MDPGPAALYNTPPAATGGGDTHVTNDVTANVTPVQPACVETPSLSPGGKTHAGGPSGDGGVSQRAVALNLSPELQQQILKMPRAQAEELLLQMQQSQRQGQGQGQGQGQSGQPGKGAARNKVVPVPQQGGSQKHNQVGG